VAEIFAIPKLKTLVPAVATVRQVSRSAPVPAAATVSQQGAFSASPSLAACSHKEAVDYLTKLTIKKHHLSLGRHSTPSHTPTAQYIAKKFELSPI